MISYSFLADFYDELMRDVDYEKLADFYERVMSQCGNVKSVLDAACGTGTLTDILAHRGYDMIAVDMSPEMLAVAREKFAVSDESIITPLLLNQPLNELDLYGTVDAAICATDGLNYLDKTELNEALKRIFLFLEPGGVFAFDINTPEKFADMDGQIYIDETDDVYCVWRTEIDQEKQACVYYVDIFSQEKGDMWHRESEEHYEYIYFEEQMKAMLSEAGFINIASCSAPWDSGCEGKDYRLCFSARKPGEFHEI